MSFKNQNLQNPKNFKVSKQFPQLKNWCFTFNNYKPEDISLLETKFQEICIRYTFGEEVGEERKTPHLQGCIELNKAQRPTEFDLPKAIHWEKTRNKWSSRDYCRKEGLFYQWEKRLAEPFRILHINHQSMSELYDELQNLAELKAEISSRLDLEEEWKQYFKEISR